MLLLILSVVLLGLGIALFCLAWDRAVWACIGVTAIAFGVVASLSGGIIAMWVQVNKDIDYQNALHDREVLVYRLEHQEENLVGNELLYAEIVDFNNRLRFEKKWANNLWVGVFNNELIADLDYIEYKEVPNQ